MYIRPIEPKDYAAATAIRNSAHPEPVPVEVFAEWCELDPKRNIHYHHLVAVDEAGRVMGTAIACHNGHRTDPSGRSGAHSNQQ